MKYKLQKKYIIVGSLLILGFLCILFGTSRLLKEPLVERWNEEEMEKVAEEAVTLLNETNWKVPREKLDSLGFENYAFITVINEKKELLATTRSWEAQRGYLGKKTLKILSDSEEELEKYGKSFSSEFDENNKASFMEIFRVPQKGYVIIRKSMIGLNSSTRVMEICFLIAAIVTLMCGIPLIIYFSGRLAKPVMEINQVTRKIACLDFKEKAQVSSNDELGDLAESVNQMSDRLKTALENLQQDVELRKTLVRNMAHELKTPVSVILGYAENMSAIAKVRPEKQETYIRVILQECERMDSMIRQMLEVSSYERGETVLHFTSFSPEELLENIIKLSKDENPHWNGKYELDCRIPGRVSGDFEILQRAVYNLVKNAVRYGKKDGIIRLGAFCREGNVHFLVHNQGEPIPEAEQEKIWNVFYKINPARTRESQSFGIGLSIVRQAALAHGGEVSVSNTKEGVEFQLFYPLPEKTKKKE